VNVEPNEGWRLGPAPSSVKGHDDRITDPRLGVADTAIGIGDARDFFSAEGDLEELQ
jgi:hypothetical protein